MDNEQSRTARSNHLPYLCAAESAASLRLSNLLAATSARTADAIHRSKNALPKLAQRIRATTENFNPSEQTNQQPTKTMSKTKTETPDEKIQQLTREIIRSLDEHGEHFTTEDVARGLWTKAVRWENKKERSAMLSRLIYLGAYRCADEVLHEQEVEQLERRFPDDIAREYGLN
jgi:hypothetical protein